MDDISYIVQKQIMSSNDPMACPIACRHWLMFFMDNDLGEIIAYDTKDPKDCYSAIRAKHPNYEFMELQGVDSVASAVEVAKAIRLSAKVLAWVKKSAALRKQVTAA